MSLEPGKTHRGTPVFHNFQITEADRRLIVKLSAEHQAILSLSGPYAKIAFALNLPKGTVKSRIHRARAALVALRPKQPEPA